jgi:hypothetical protein
MTDKDEKDPRPQKDRILRAKDIIPGAELIADSGKESGAKEFDIPQFNLAQDLLSVQRRQSAFRRKGPEAAEDRRPGFAQGATPGRQKTEDGGQRTESKLWISDGGLQILGEERTKKVGWRLAVGIETLRDSIIAEIVARDIEHLCAGH